MEVKQVAKAVTKAQLGNCLNRIALYFANTLSKTVNFDGIVPNDLNIVKHYGECSTVAETAGKTVSCDGFVLVAGAKIAVKFTVTNTAANPTLSVNNTTAKPIYYHGAVIPPNYLAQNHVYQFIYDGANYELVGDVDTTSGAGDSCFDIDITGSLTPALYPTSSNNWQIDANGNIMPADIG
jgi:hypothetical protein